jgi:hypothetical protein
MNIVILFVLYFILDLSTITSFDEYQGFTVPGVGFLTYNTPATTFSGFCLSEPDRVITNFSQPLYSVNIYQSYQGTNPAGVSINWIPIILLREVIGYNVFIIDNSAETNTEWTTSFTTPNIILGNPQVADFTIDSGYANGDTNYQSLLAQYVGDGKLLQYYGDLSAVDQSSTFVHYQVILDNPDLNLLHWSAYTKGVASNSIFSNLYLPYSIQRDIMVTNNIEATRNISWSYFQDGTFAQWSSDPILSYILGSPQVACPPDSTLIYITGLDAGCNDPKYPSMYIPPQCYPYPELQCTIFIEYPPYISGSKYASNVLALNMSVVIAYVSYYFFLDPNVQNGKYKLNLGSSTALQVGTSQCIYTDSYGNNITTNCFREVMFPLYDPSCNIGYNGSYNSAYYCAPQNNIHSKFVRSDLKQRAPRVDYLINNANFNTFDTNQMLHSTNDLDYKRKACNWILNNKATWSQWILPPAQCTPNDYYFELNTCDEISGTQTVNYYWNLPKACQEGVSLPVSQTFSCGYLAFRNSKSIAPILLSSFFLLSNLLVSFIFSFKKITIYNFYGKHRCSISIGSILLFVSIIIQFQNLNNSICLGTTILFLLAIESYLWSLQYGVLKLKSIVFNDFIIHFDYYHYFSFLASIGLMLLILLLDSLNGNSWLSINYNQLSGGYNYPFNYCAIPSLWCQIVIIFGLISHWVYLFWNLGKIYIYYFFSLDKKITKRKKTIETHKKVYFTFLANSIILFIIFSIWVITYYVYSYNPQSSNNSLYRSMSHIALSMLLLLTYNIIFRSDKVIKYIFENIIIWAHKKSENKISPESSDKNREVIETVKVGQEKVSIYTTYPSNTSTNGKIKDIFFVPFSWWDMLKSTERHYIDILNKSTYLFFDTALQQDDEKSINSLTSMVSVNSKSISISESTDKELIDDFTHLNRLTKILKNPIVYQKFYEFSKIRRSSENLDFLNDIKRLHIRLFYIHEDQYSSYLEINNCTQQIISKYIIDEDGPNALNIKGIMRKEVQENAKKLNDFQFGNSDASASREFRHYTWEIFTPVIVEVFNLIESNDIQYFVRSTYVTDANRNYNICRDLEDIKLKDNEETKAIFHVLMSGKL